MVTSPKIQADPTVTQGLPAYKPDQDKWLASLNGVFANPTETKAAIKQAAGQIWSGWSAVPWSVESIFGNTVTPGLVSRWHVHVGARDTRCEHQVSGAERRLAGRKQEVVSNANDSSLGNGCPRRARKRPPGQACRENA